MKKTIKILIFLLIISLAVESVVRNVFVIFHAPASFDASHQGHRIGPYLIYREASNPQDALHKRLGDTWVIQRDGETVYAESDATGDGQIDIRAIYLNNLPLISWNKSRRPDFPSWLSYEIYRDKRHSHYLMDLGVEGFFRYRKFPNKPMEILKDETWVPAKSMESLNATINGVTH